MADAGKLAALQRLAALKKATDLGSLACAARSRAEIQDQITSLDMKLADAFAAVRGEVEAGLLPALDHYARLNRQDRGQLNSSLARLTAEWLERRAAATRSFGVCAALERLHHAETARRRAARQRKAE